MEAIADEPATGVLDGKVKVEGHRFREKRNELGDSRFGVVDVGKETVQDPIRNTVIGLFIALGHQ